VEPDIRYARNVDVAIAYQVVGQGDRDLVLVPDYMSNLVYDWESRYFRDMYLRFARSFRLILFDKRGTGLSDHGGGAFAALETRMEDLRAVLDAAGSERAVVLGQHEGGAMAALYAATYPERTEALVLFQAATEGTDDPERERSLDALRDNWGTQRLADTMLAEVCPTLLRSEADRLWFANRLRVGASPEVAYQLNRVFMETDLSDVLPAIRVPTLVLYRSDVDGNEQDTLAMSALIPDARVVRLAGNDYWGMFLSPGIVDEVESFVESVGDEIGTNSVLATLVFTDLADSTALAHRLGDRGWAEMVGTTRPCGPSFGVSAASRSTLPATASSRRSTDRRGRSAAGARSETRCASSTCASASESTRASVRLPAASLPGSPSRPRRGSRQPPSPARYSSRRR